MIWYQMFRYGNFYKGEKLYLELKVSVLGEVWRQGYFAREKFFLTLIIYLN